MKTRICSKCERKLPLTSVYFYVNSCEKSGFGYPCKECKNAYSKNHRRSPRSKKARRKENLRCKFNLTLKQYDQMFEQQNGKCAICNQIDISGKRLSVDHDHRTGEIRGLLCMNCNLLLGRVESTPELFSKMMKYLGV